MKRILFVDDDRYFAHRYVDQLAAMFTVDFFHSAKGALDAFRSGAQYDAAIIDVMMPAPDGFTDATDDGWSTGIWLVNEVLEKIMNQRIAIVFLTNRNRRAIVTACEALPLPPELVTVSEKLAVQADQLPQLIAAAIARSSSVRAKI